jgi:hypothetical protein
VPPTAVATPTPGAATEAPATTEPTPVAGRESNEQTFGPQYSAQPAVGGPVWIGKAELSADRLTLTIEFGGGRPYLASDACSADYEPWVAARGDQLDVEVVEVDRPDQATGGACTLMGYGHTYHLKLGAPFTGTTVNDLAQGGTLYVGTPPGAFVATSLPNGWSLQRALQQEPGPPPIWVEVYAAASVGNQPFEGPGQLVLYQAFGVIGEWTDTRSSKSEARGGHPVAVTLNGKAATVWVDEASGELLLAWTLNGQSLGLIGNAADMTPQELATFAEGVALGAQ